MFVSIIYLKIKYCVFVFYLWYLFVASAFVCSVIFYFFVNSSVSSSLLSEHNLLVWFYNLLKCAVMDRALPEQKKRTKLCVRCVATIFTY